MAVFFALLVLSASGLVVLSGVITDRARAQLAADAAALAGAAAGPDEADSIAQANGATVVAYDTKTGPGLRSRVTVRVALGNSEAQAVAERYPEVANSRP